MTTTNPSTHRTPPRGEPAGAWLTRALHGAPASAYMRNMWRQVLASAGAADESWHDRCGQLQLPYVPIRPEDYGVQLDTSSQVLDIGSFGGYGIYDFCRRRAAEGLPLPRITGVDIDADACECGRQLAAVWAARGPAVRFVEASCEAMPFASGTFDLLIARTVLPYVDLARTVRELRRVLRPQGLAVIQVHAPRYYLSRSRQCLRARMPRQLVYYLRPIMSSGVLGVAGRQPRARRFRETALTLPQLVGLCEGVGLRPVLRHPTRYRPLAVFRAVA